MKLHKRLEDIVFSDTLKGEELVIDSIVAKEESWNKVVSRQSSRPQDHDSIKFQESMEEETRGMMQNNKYACLGESVSCVVVEEEGGELLEYGNNNVDEKDDELIIRDTNKNVEGGKDEQILKC